MRIKALLVWTKVLAGFGIVVGVLGIGGVVLGLPVLFYNFGFRGQMVLGGVLLVLGSLWFLAKRRNLVRILRASSWDDVIQKK